MKVLCIKCGAPTGTSILPRPPAKPFCAKCKTEREVLTKPAPAVARNRAYLDWLRTRPCIACDAIGGCDPAHVRIGGDGGVGLKPSDYRAVPLCRGCHDHQHRRGERTFWLELEEFRGLSAEAAIAACLVAYLGNKKGALETLAVLVETER